MIRLVLRLVVAERLEGALRGNVKLSPLFPSFLCG